MITAATIEAIRKRFRERPDTDWCRGCYRRFRRAREAWQKEADTARRNSITVHQLAKEKIDQLIELEEQIEKLKETLDESDDVIIRQDKIIQKLEKKLRERKAKSKNHKWRLYIDREDG